MCEKTCTCDKCEQSKRPPIDWMKPVQTKEGIPLRVLCTNSPGPWPVKCLSPKGEIYHYLMNGNCNENTNYVYSTDAVNVPAKPKKVTVVTLKSHSSGNVIMRTKEEVERGAYKTWIVLKSEEFEYYEDR